MKVILRNFKCYEHSEAELGLGVTLIKGVSGVGKTTIAEAIAYVLYGGRKPYMHGKKRCSVTLSLPGEVTIFRQSGPGRLVLTANGKNYEDATAQSILDSMYGKREDFFASSYLRQNERCALMMGTTKDKMALVRAASFRDDKIEVIQDTLRKALKTEKSQSDELRVKFSSVSLALERFDKTHGDLSSVELDASSSPADFERMIASINTQIKDLETRIEETLEKEARIQALGEITPTGSLDELREEVRNIEEESAELSEKIEAARAAQAKLNASKQLISLRKTAAERVTTLEKERAELKEKYALEEEEFEIEIDRLTKLEEVRSQISAVLQRFKVNDPSGLRDENANCAAKLRKLRVELNELESSLDNIEWNRQQKELLVCPKCSATLRVENRKLHLSDKDYSPEVRDVKNPNATKEKVAACQQEIASIGARKEELGAALLEVGNLKKLAGKNKAEDQGKLEAIQRYKEIGQLLVKFNEELEAIGDIDESQESDVDVGDLQASFNELNARKEKVLVQIAEHTKFSEYAKLRKELTESLGEFSSAKLREQKSERQAEKVRVQKMRDLRTLLDQRAELKVEKDNAQKKHEESSKRAQNISTLLETSKRVEREILTNTVAVLNAAMAEYLEVLFPDDPITVEFQTTKDIKSRAGAKSMTCSLKIYYKNSAYDDPRQLSGGERDRVSLAMTIALNRLTGSNILILDETLHGLDPSLKISVVEFIRRFCGQEKVCVIISHEGVEGVYDQIISL